MPTRVNRKVILYILTLILSQATFAWPVTDTIAPQTIFFSQDDHTLTVNLDNFPLREALQNLANQLPITITLKGITGQKKLSTRFTHLPVEQGIERLLQGQDYAILYSHAPSSQQALPKEIIVLPRKIVSENTISSEITILASPNVDQETLLRHQTSHKKHQNQSLTKLAHTIESLIKTFDQTPSQNISETAETSQAQDSEIRTIVRTLLQESEAISP